MGPIFRRIAAIPHHGPDRPPVARDPTQIHPGGFPVGGGTRHNLPGHRYLFWRNENLRFTMKEAMQLDATPQLPDGKQIPVVVELDATQLETSLADTGLADVVARAVEVLGSRPRALAWLRTPVGGLDGKTPLEAVLTTPSGHEGKAHAERPTR